MGGDLVLLLARRQAMVPNRLPWVHTASAQPDTIASMASGRASVVKSRSRTPSATGASASATMASRTEPPTRYRVCPADRKRSESSAVASTKGCSRSGNTPPRVVRLA